MTTIKPALLLLAYCVMACNYTHLDDVDVAGAPEPSPRYKWYVKANTSPFTGWGYEIYMDTKPIITQQVIPALEGSVPFKTRKDAASVAGLVVVKLLAGKPPAVSRAELDSLGVEIQAK